MSSLKGRPRRLYALRFGWEPVTEAVSLRGGSPDEYLFEPVTGAAVVYDEGWVLIDTGSNPEMLRDPVQRAAHYVNGPVACIPCGETTHAHLADEAARAIERLHALDRLPRTEVWPGHDPEFWATRRAPPAAYA